MAPNDKNNGHIIAPATEDSGEMETEDRLEKLVAPQAAPRKFEILYLSILAFSYCHVSALYGLYLCFTRAMWTTIVFNWILYTLSIIGVTAGVHRLWSHRAYKAKMPLQIILIVMNSLAFQNSAIHWVRDHRVHHRYSDTDADPHNSTRGFFYSHIGWMLVKKHPEVQRRGKFIDMSDIYANPVLRFQKKYVLPFLVSICFLLPTIIPMYIWGETLNNAWHVVLLRYVISLNGILAINSFAHLFGSKPYDINIKPVQSLLVSFMSFGEGFHNYHHVYPWDYRAAELGNNWLNLSTKFIDFFAWVGWAYDLKTVPKEMVKKRMVRTGDSSNEWGWGQMINNDC